MSLEFAPAQALHNERARDERAQDERARDLERAKALVNLRKARQAEVYPNGGPQHAMGGVMGKLMHNTELTAEGIAGQMIMILIFNTLKALFSTQFHIQRAEFTKAQGLGIAYEPNADGEWPEVYPLDHEGKVNYAAVPNRDGTADRIAVRCNGLVPKASLTEAYHIQWTEYQSDMMGMQSLTQQERMLLTNTFDAAKLKHQEENQGPDVASDAAANRMRQGAPEAPRPQPQQRRL